MNYSNVSLQVTGVNINSRIKMQIWTQKFHSSLILTLFWINMNCRGTPHWGIIHSFNHFCYIYDSWGCNCFKPMITQEEHINWICQIILFQLLYYVTCCIINFNNHFFSFLRVRSKFVCCCIRLLWSTETCTLAKTTVFWDVTLCSLDIRFIWNVSAHQNKWHQILSISKLHYHHHEKFKSHM